MRSYRKKLQILLTLACLGVNAGGCESAGSADEKTQTGYEQTDSEEENMQSENETDGADVIDQADLFGSVIDFTETGFTLSKGSATEDTSITSAEGASVSDAEKISVIYGEDTEFQIAVMTMTSTTLEDGSREDVRKSSDVYVCGTEQADKTFLAARVIVSRFQGQE